MKLKISIYLNSYFNKKLKWIYERNKYHISSNMSFTGKVATAVKTPYPPPLFPIWRLRYVKVTLHNDEDGDAQIMMDVKEHLFEEKEWYKGEERMRDNFGICWINHFISPRVAKKLDEQTDVDYSRVWYRNNLLRFIEDYAVIGAWRVA